MKKTPKKLKLGKETLSAMENVRAAGEATGNSTSERPSICFGTCASCGQTTCLYCEGGAFAPLYHPH